MSKEKKMDNLIEEIRKLKSLLSESGPYSVVRSDQEPIGLGEALYLGSIFETIDQELNALDQQDEFRQHGG